MWTRPRASTRFVVFRLDLVFHSLPFIFIPASPPSISIQQQTSWQRQPSTDPRLPCGDPFFFGLSDALVSYFEANRTRAEFLGFRYKEQEEGWFIGSIDSLFSSPFSCPLISSLPASMWWAHHRALRWAHMTNPVSMSIPTLVCCVSGVFYCDLILRSGYSPSLFLAIEISSTIRDTTLPRHCISRYDMALWCPRWCYGMTTNVRPRHLISIDVSNAVI